MFVQNETYASGEHQQLIQLPSGLAAGNYFIVISATGGSVAVKIIHE
jgi:hypothetical protein